MSQTAATPVRFLSWLRPRTLGVPDPTVASAEQPTQVTPAPAPSTPRKFEDEPLRWLAAEVHARLLCHVVYMGEMPLAPGNILSRDLARIYREMCGELGLIEHSWQITSNLTRRQLGPVKTYCWHISADGTRSRLRVFKFLRVRPCVLTDEEQILVEPLRL